MLELGCSVSLTRAELGQLKPPLKSGCCHAWNSSYYTRDMDWGCERAEMQRGPRLLAGVTSPEHQNPEYPTIPLGFCTLVASWSTGRTLVSEFPLKKKGRDTGVQSRWYPVVQIYTQH